jgi:lysozyme
LGIAAAFLAAAALWPRRSDASTGAENSGFVTADDWLTWWNMQNADGFPDTDPIETSADRLGAFLYMIGAAEVSPSAMQSGLAYQTFYGGSRFYNLTDHPTATGEKKGIRLPDEWCRRAGFGPGCVSTAAGAYQITLTTWRDVRKAGSWGPYLADFSPASQNEAARRILILCGAWPLIETGDFEGALARASTRWASLPGSTAGQGVKTFADVYAYYSGALGVA